MIDIGKGTVFSGGMRDVLDRVTHPEGRGTLEATGYNRTFQRVFYETRYVESTTHGLPVRRMRRAFTKKRYSILTGEDLDFSDKNVVCIDDPDKKMNDKNREMLQRWTRAIWFDLSTLPWPGQGDDTELPVWLSSVAERGDDGDWDYSTASGAVAEQLADMFTHPPAPEIVIFAHYRTDTGARLAVGQYLDLRSVTKKDDDHYSYITLTGAFDFDTRLWVLMDDEVVKHSHSSYHKHRPLMVMYALARLAEDIQETTLSTRTGKPMCESANPPAGTSYKIVQLTPQARERHEHQGGTHASPRKHWRRGHWRHLRNGDRIWIDGMVVGSDERGEVRHDYVVLPEIPETEGLEK